MKKWFISFAAFALFAAAPLTAQIKIVTVSMEKLLDGYYKREEVQTSFDNLKRTLTEQQQDRQQKLVDREKAIQTMQQDLENPLMSGDAKTSKEDEIKTAFDEYRRERATYEQWVQESARNLQVEFNQRRDELLKEITTVVGQVAVTENADLILDTSRTALVPAVIFASPRLDITDKVMVELNKNAPQQP